MSKEIVYDFASGKYVVKVVQPAAPAQKLVGPGVYEYPLENGQTEIYVVKWNHDKTRCYAKRLVEAPSERLTETNEHVQFDFVYEQGAIFKLRPEHQMDTNRAKELMIRYGRCICCGRTLVVAESVERGLGPVCVKFFRQVKEVEA